jgi:S1-C subfamily serine protease
VRELKQQLVSALLVIVTVAAVVAAAINLQQQSRFHLPDDGITWSDQMQGAGRNSAVVAVYVAPGSPGEKAGIHKGDQLVSVADLTIQRALDVTAVLARLGPHKTGKGCLYLRRLDDVDQDVLRELIDRSVRVRKGADRAST